MRRRTFTPHFSDSTHLQKRCDALATANAAQAAELADARDTIKRLREEKTDLLNRMNSEAWRLKQQGGCYTRCSVMKPKVAQ